MLAVLDGLGWRRVRDALGPCVRVRDSSHKEIARIGYVAREIDARKRCDRTKDDSGELVGPLEIGGGVGFGR